MNSSRLFLLAFSCLLCVSLGTIAKDNDVFCKEGYKYRINTDGTVDIIEYNSYDNGALSHDTLRIPSTVSIEDKEYRISTIGRQAFAGEIGIRHLVIDEGVSQIADKAFIGCLNLESVVLPSSVKHYDRDMFAYCPRLRYLKTSDPYNDCNALIDAEDSILFVGCKGTVIPPCVQEIDDYAFYNCTGLEELTIPEGVRKIGNNAFRGCKNLKSIHLPGTLEEIGNEAFSECESLMSLEIPEGVREVGCQIFERCTSLKSLTVSPDNPHFDSRGGCNGIVCSLDSTLIAACGATTLPEGIVGIGPYSFYNVGIRELHFPSTMRDIPAEEFWGADKISTITVAAGNPRYCSPEGCNAVLSLDGDTLVLGCSTTVIPSSVSVIGECSFWGREERSVLTLPYGLESIERNAFHKCNRLFYVQIPASVRSLDFCAFSYCSNLCIADLSSQLEFIGDECFSGCTNLNVINTGSKLRFIGERAFQDCPCEKYVREKFADICR